MSSNQFENLSDPLFAANNSLSVNSNALAIIDPDLFSEMTRLTTLSLVSNKLINVDKKQFKGLANLTSLDMRHNQFVNASQVEIRAAFSKMGNANLCNVYLAGNSIYASMSSSKLQLSLSGSNVKCKIN